VASQLSLARIGDTTQHTIRAQNQKRIAPKAGDVRATHPVRKLGLRILEGIETWT
jgi:hypothetical protein